MAAPSDSGRLECGGCCAVPKQPTTLSRVCCSAMIGIRLYYPDLSSSSHIKSGTRSARAVECHAECRWLPSGAWPAIASLTVSQLLIYCPSRLNIIEPGNGQLGFQCKEHGLSATEPSSVKRTQMAAVVSEVPEAPASNPVPNDQSHLPPGRRKYRRLEPTTAEQIASVSTHDLERLITTPLAGAPLRPPACLCAPPQAAVGDHRVQLMAVHAAGGLHEQLCGAVSGQCGGWWRHGRHVWGLHGHHGNGEAPACTVQPSRPAAGRMGGPQGQLAHGMISSPRACRGPPWALSSIRTRRCGRPSGRWPKTPSAGAGTPCKPCHAH